MALIQLPTSLLASRAARIDLARRQFFEEGVAPTGIVTDAVFQSWSRCLRLRHRPDESVEFEPVTTSRAHLALQKNRQLLQAWLEVLPKLDAVLGATSCAAMLTDQTGVLIGASCAGRAHEELMPVATRVGVNLSEEAVGTTAPGVVARTGKAVYVLGADHFFESVKNMQCAAVPIRDITGSLAGVLDISSETIPFTFDAAAVVGFYAGSIENRLLIRQSSDHLVIRLQVAEELLDSSLVGLIGIDSGGRVAWQNGAARSLLGLQTSEDIVRHDAEALLDLTVSQLASLPSAGAAVLTLPNGLMVWARAEMRSPDGLRRLVAAAPASKTQGAPGSQPLSMAAMISTDVRLDSQTLGTDSEPLRKESAAATKSTLRELDKELIMRTLQACNGNVSRAAKSLSVSRNLIYRRLRMSIKSKRH